jgi:CrcB protein
MMRLLLVCLGGALGSGARYLTYLAVPNGTFLVNVIGSFLIAIAIELLGQSELRLFVITGILGGFTTYSTFNQETLQMMRIGSWAPAAINAFGTLVACLGAGFLGLAVARMLR